jgi:hypothetical protein
MIVPNGLPQPPFSLLTPSQWLFWRLNFLGGKIYHLNFFKVAYKSFLKECILKWIKKDIIDFPGNYVQNALQ